MNTIQEQWRLFKKAAVPKNAPAIQVQEMRRAFYAGAKGVLRIQFNLADRSVSEDAAVEILEGVHDECRRFAAEVWNGKA